MQPVNPTIERLAPGLPAAGPPVPHAGPRPACYTGAHE